MPRAKYCTSDEATAVIGKLTTDNAKVVLIAAATGLRIGDVVTLTWRELEDGRCVEDKTGKARKIDLPEILRIMLPRRGKLDDYVFVGRGKAGHRTRQAVNKDMAKVCRELQVERISPHSIRKLFAVDLYQKCNDLDLVQRMLNHEYLSTTLLYAFSDKIK